MRKLVRTHKTGVTFMEPKKARNARRTSAREKPTPTVWGLSEHVKRELKLVPHSALSDFLGKHAVDEWHWNALAFRVHLGAALADLADQDVRQHFVDAIACIGAVYTRHKDTGVWHVEASEGGVIGDALNFTDQLQDISTRAEQRQRGIALVRANISDIRRIGLSSKEAALNWIR